MQTLRFLYFCFVLAISLGAAVLVLRHPSSPVPHAWNPFKPLAVSDPVTLLTPLKLDQAVRDPALCLAVLSDADTGFSSMPDLVESADCGITNRVSLTRVGASRLSALETTCDVALRMEMWERHSLQPLARAHFGTEISSIAHLSSYNCRTIRGSSTRMSLHATGEAIDIVGFNLADGRRLRLLDDWDREQAFFAEIRDEACRWFETVLGPDYNALHANHFHLQSRGWGTCR